MLLAHVHHSSSFGPIILLAVEALEVLGDLRSSAPDSAMLAFLVRDSVYLSGVVSVPRLGEQV